VNFELRHLRHFVAVAEAGQVTAAARRLHLAQPALTQSIHALERAVGASLLERHPRGVRLTGAGERFLHGALATLRACDEAVAAARDLAPETRAVVVGAIPAAPQIGGILAAFRRERPDIPVRWEPLDFSRDGRAVADGTVDVCFTIADYGLPDLEDAALFELPAFMYASVESPVASLDAVRFEDVADEVFPGQHPRVPSEFVDIFYMTALRGYRPRISATTPLTVDESFALVASGEAMTIGPGHSPTMWPEAIARIPTVDIPPFTTRMLWRAGEQRPGTLAFVNHVLATYELGPTTTRAEPLLR
jgi:DNA-binding transcriptional LysR family regulator